MKHGKLHYWSGSKVELVSVKKHPLSDGTVRFNVSDLNTLHLTRQKIPVLVNRREQLLVEVFP